METNQSSTNHNPMGVETRTQQASSNNSLFVAIIISVLLTAMIVGSGVYYWQKSVSKKKVTVLKHKVSSLEGQISTMKKAEISP